MEDALRPEWLAFVKELGLNPRIHGPTEADIRSQDAANGMAMFAKYTFPGPHESIEKIWHKTSSGTAVKSYKAATFKPDQPLLYYIHGGGFVLGSVDLDDRFCEIFAKELGCIVVSVEYRLAPEFKHPVPLEDCVDGAKWCVEHAASLGAKAGPIVMSGKSAGGGLVFGTALKLIDEGRGKDIAGLVPCQPLTVHPGAVDAEHKSKYTSYDENAENTVNTKRGMLAFYELHGAPKDDKYIFPLNHDRLGELPQVYMNACGADTLRDDARLMKKTLDSLQVPNQYEEYDKLPHYFFAFPSSHLDSLKSDYFEKTCKGIAWAMHG